MHVETKWKMWAMGCYVAQLRELSPSIHDSLGLIPSTALTRSVTLHLRSRAGESVKVILNFSELKVSLDYIRSMQGRKKGREEKKGGGEAEGDRRKKLSTPNPCNAVLTSIEAG